MQKPKLLAVLGGEYSKKQFIKDLTSGFMIGILAIPLSIALAIASGVSPERGLYTAIIAGLASFRKTDTRHLLWPLSWRG